MQNKKKKHTHPLHLISYQRDERREDEEEGGGGGEEGGIRRDQNMLNYLLPSWKRANSSAVLSSTVRAVTVTGPLALLGKQPCSLTSCQSEWILQMSTESKYLHKEADENPMYTIISWEW